MGSQMIGLHHHITSSRGVEETSFAHKSRGSRSCVSMSACMFMQVGCEACQP